jgi:hypothetical protein
MPGRPDGNRGGRERRATVAGVAKDGRRALEGPVVLGLVGEGEGDERLEQQGLERQLGQCRAVSEGGDGPRSAAWSTPGIRASRLPDGTRVQL